MTVCLLVVKSYDARLQDHYVARFGRFAEEHVENIEANLYDPDSTIADIVVMPDGFAAAMRDFERFCVDPEVSR